MKVLKNYRRISSADFMQTTQIKTLSLLYHTKEDRMILLLNKDDVDSMVYWITRRFYFSLFFELDTYLDKLGIVDKLPSLETKIPDKKYSSPKGDVSVSENKKVDDIIKKENKQIEDFLLKPPYIVLENVSLSQTQNKLGFKLIFKAGNMLSESTMSKDDFIKFYHLMKTSYPRGEWGII